MARWKRIGCAIDLSDASRLALDESAYWARIFGAELTLVHVFEEQSGGWGETSGALRRRDAEAMLASWRAQAEFLADRQIGLAMLEGRPHEQIIRFARERGFDLLIVGSYGRSGLKLRVLGSVAESVLRAAHCPVLVVRHLRRETVADEAP